MAAHPVRAVTTQTLPFQDTAIVATLEAQVRDAVLPASQTPHQFVRHTSNNHRRMLRFAPTLAIQASGEPQSPRAIHTVLKNGPWKHSGCEEAPRTGLPA